MADTAEFRTYPERVRIAEGWAEDDYGDRYRTETVTLDREGDLITSRITDETHLPLVDLDVAAILRPSKTPGHFHLIIDKPMSWRRYKRLLRALVKAGLVEQGWERMVRRRRQALLAAPDSGSSTS